MKPDELLEYDEQLTEYFEILIAKLHADKISVKKFGRLADKINEWSNEAERKAADE